MKKTICLTILFCFALASFAQNESAKDPVTITITTSDGIKKVYDLNTKKLISESKVEISKNAVVEIKKEIVKEKTAVQTEKTITINAVDVKSTQAKPKTATPKFDNDGYSKTSVSEDQKTGVNKQSSKATNSQYADKTIPGTLVPLPVTTVAQDTEPVAANPETKVKVSNSSDAEQKQPVKTVDPSKTKQD